MMTAIESRLYNTLKTIVDAYEDPDTLGEQLFEVVARQADAARFALRSAERAAHVRSVAAGTEGHTDECGCLR